MSLKFRKFDSDFWNPADVGPLSKLRLIHKIKRQGELKNTNECTMVERSLRARARALHVREHGWWRATHVADHGWARAHEEASRNVESATEKITDLKEKISPMIEERDTLKREYCLIKERLNEHKKGAATLRKLLQKSVDMLQARAQKLEKGRSHVRGMENETKELEKRNRKELATIKEEIDVLSTKSAELEKEWIETREKNQKLNEDQHCELQCINEECVKTCHELVKLDAENEQIRCNIEKNKNRSHICRPDLARDIKILTQLQQELEEILTDSQNQGDKYENRTPTKMLPRQCDGSVGFGAFLDCLNRTLESSLNKSIADEGDVISCDLLESVVDNVDISDENTAFLRSVLKSLLAKDLYGSIDTCLEKNGVEDAESNNGSSDPPCKGSTGNKYGTTNQPNDGNVMQIKHNRCIPNSCPAESLTQSGDKFSTCCLNIDTIYVIPLKEYDKNSDASQMNFKTSPDTGEENLKVDFKPRKISSTEIPIGCIEYEVTCSNCGINRSIGKNDSYIERKGDGSLGDNTTSAQLLNQILELKCNTDIGEPHGDKNKNPQNIQFSPTAEPNLNAMYVLPTCSENFENLGTPTPISSIDLTPVHIDQRLSTCPYCTRQSKTKESSGKVCKDTSYSNDFINMVSLSDNCKKKVSSKVVSEVKDKKTRKSSGISKDLIAECLQGEPCLPCDGVSGESDNLKTAMRTNDMNIQCEESLPEKPTEKSCLENLPLEKILQAIDIPKFLEQLLKAISQRNEVNCLCKMESKNTKREIETNTYTEVLGGQENGDTNQCFCDAKEGVCEAKLTKNIDCKCHENEIKLTVSSDLREKKHVERTKIVDEQSNPSCLCDKPVKACTCTDESTKTDVDQCRDIVSESSAETENNLQTQGVICFCNEASKVCACGLESTKIDCFVCEKNVTKSPNKIPNNLKMQNVSCLCNEPLEVCMCKYESTDIDDCKCQKNVKKLSTQIPDNLQAQDMSCLCDKLLKVCTCGFESTEICDVECRKKNPTLPNNSQTQNVSCLCDKPLEVCMCKYEFTDIDDCICQTKLSTQIPDNLPTNMSCLCNKPVKVCACGFESAVDCKLQEIETKSSFKESGDTCSTNCTNNFVPVQSSDVICLCEKPLKKCTCDEVNSQLSNLYGNITEKTLSNLCVCEKCQNIHLNLLKKLAQCASYCPENACFADEILKKVGSFTQTCINCGNDYEECDCNGNAFDTDKVDEIIGTPRSYRSATTNTFNDCIETCTSYRLPVQEDIAESDLKSQSNISDLNTDTTFNTPQNSASKLVLHSNLSSLRLDDSKFKSSNSVTFESPVNVDTVDDTGTQISSCRCSKDDHRKDVMISTNVCDSNEEIQAVTTCGTCIPQRTIDISKDSCQNEVSSNTSSTCYSRNLTNDEIIKLFLGGTNLKPDDLRKALKERLCGLKKSLESIDESESGKKSCRTTHSQSSTSKKDATDGSFKSCLPCSTKGTSTSSQNISSPSPIQYPSCEILNEEISPKKPTPNQNLRSEVKDTSVAPKKRCPNKFPNAEQTQNIKNKPVSPKKRAATKFPCSEPPKNMSTNLKQRSPGRCPGAEKPSPSIKSANSRKYSPGKCPALDTQHKSTRNPEVQSLKQQNTASTLSCGCVEETIKSTDYTQGDKVSIGCSARNSLIRCVPMKRNTINSQVPSYTYPSTPNNSVTTACYNDIDEIPTRLNNYESNIDKSCRSEKCYTNAERSHDDNNSCGVVSLEFYCDRSTSCVTLLQPATKNLEKAKFDATTLTEEVDYMNRNNSSTIREDVSFTRKCECPKDTARNTTVMCKKGIDAMTNTDKVENLDKTHKNNNKNKLNQGNIEQNKKINSRSTCISSSSEMNNTFSDTDTIVVPISNVNERESLNNVPCTCETRRDNSRDMNTQRTKSTCTDGTSMSDVTCRKRKKPMYSQSNDTQQPTSEHKNLDESCICNDNLRSPSMNNDNRRIETESLSKCTKSTCGLPPESNHVSALSCFNEKSSDNVRTDHGYTEESPRYEPCLCTEKEKNENKPRYMQNNSCENNLEVSNENCVYTSECQGSNSTENRDTIEITENIHDTDSKCQCKEISPKGTHGNDNNQKMKDLTDEEENKAIIFCSDEWKTSSYDHVVGDMSDIKTESHTRAWKQRYVVLKPRSNSFLSCNRSTCSPITNNDKKLLVQVPCNTENSSNTKCISCIKIDDVPEKSEIIQTKEESVESIPTKEDSVEAIQTRRESVEKIQPKKESVEKIQPKKESVEKIQTEKGSVEKIQPQIKTVEIVKTQDACVIKKKDDKLCRTSIKKYEIISKTKLKTDEKCGKIDKKKIRCKTPERDGEMCSLKRVKDESSGTFYEKSDESSGTLERKSKKYLKRKKQDDKFNALEKKIEQYTGKKKIKCKCSI